MKKKRLQPGFFLAAGTVVFLLFLLLLAVYGWKNGLFRSMDALQSFIRSCGIWAPLAFVFMQVCQILLAFIPGGILLSGGVLAFGPALGLLYNMAGTAAGSWLNFELAKRWGKPIVRHLVPEKTRQKYFTWLDEKPKRFTRLFAVAILLPFFPDDALCLIAGLTPMSRRTFLLILLLKLPTVAAYSLLYLAAAKGAILLPPPN